MLVVVGVVVVGVVVKAHNIVPIADGIGRPEYSGRPDFQTGRDSTAPKMAGRAGQWSTMQKAS